MSPWQAWLALAALLVIVEILSPGFVFACFALASLAAAVAAALGGSWQMQLVVFATTLLGVFVALRPVLVRTLYRRSTVRTNVEALVGKTGIVLEPVDALGMSGRVKVGGEEWKGRSINATIGAGTQVVVTGIEGNTLVVRTSEEKGGNTCSSS